MNKVILIVEDEARLAEILGEYLVREGFRTERAKDGKRALELWRAARPDLILLDLMLPLIDGLEVARRVRAESDVPIIMLTARDEEVDKLVGLGLGADDYVVKPYSPREVVARVKAVLRRTNAHAPSGLLSVGALSVDLSTYLTRCHGEEIALTPSELQILAHLAREPGVVRGRAELLAVLGDDRFADLRTVDAHVKNLRRKLGPCGDQLETVRGVGYRVRP
ncbi:MAG: Two-component transcriptional response regulator, winged helix family [uncultured Truepera sp.]|uniref:Two-component transcriptional response regulator, winged helix family n=1 Tax=uncultured Truepera sp. TaxID=543023 RepID=A0A6J4VD85_9DEIN|nr:MAG: Two-component transcriptional response regulator, winged helix family [uncultured Truepera sp.]